MISILDSSTLSTSPSFGLASIPALVELTLLVSAVGSFDEIDFDLSLKGKGASRHTH